jgi:hypothetical protein
MTPACRRLLRALVAVPRAIVAGDRRWSTHH